MSFENILNGNLRISSMADEQGRKYYTIKLAFSENDVVSVYRNSIDELITELPDIIGSAVQARIMNDELIIN